MPIKGIVTVLDLGVQIRFDAQGVLTRVSYSPVDTQTGLAIPEWKIGLIDENNQPVILPDLLQQLKIKDDEFTKTFFSSFSSNSLPPSRTAFIETTNIIMQNIPKTIFIVPRTRAKTAIIDVIIIAWDIWSKSFLIILNPEISAVMPNTTPISIILAPNKVPAAIRDESLNIEIMLIDNSGSEVATASNKNPVVPWLKPVISENLTAYSITHLLVLIKINSPMINIRISGIIYIIAWLVIYKGAR